MRASRRPASACRRAAGTSRAGARSPGAESEAPADAEHDQVVAALLAGGGSVVPLVEPLDLREHLVGQVQAALGVHARADVVGILEAGEDLGRLAEAVLGVRDPGPVVGRARGGVARVVHRAEVVHVHVGQAEFARELPAGLVLELVAHAGAYRRAQVDRGPEVVVRAGLDETVELLGEEAVVLAAGLRLAIRQDAALLGVVPQEAELRAIDLAAVLGVGRRRGRLAFGVAVRVRGAERDGAGPLGRDGFGNGRGSGLEFAERKRGRD